MTSHTRTTVAAGCCSLATACALAPLFSSWIWLSYAFFTVLAVTGAALLARVLRVPDGLVPLVGLAALVLFVTGVFGDGTQLFALLPTHDTLAHLGDLDVAARTDIRQLAAPVPGREGLLLFTVGGVGLVTLVIDALSVTLRHPALAGLPIIVVISVCSAISTHGVGWLPFVAIGAGFLTLLMAEGHDRLLRWGRPFAEQDEHSWAPEAFTSSPVGQAGRRIGAAALGVALVLPVAFPFITGGGLSSLTGNGDLGSGGGPGHSSQVINPITTLRGQLTRDRADELLRVRTTDSDPFYLRLTSLDQYTLNRGWSQSPVSAPTSARVSAGLPPTGYGADVPVKTTRSAVTITGLGGSQYLPTYLAPTNVSVSGDWRYDVNSSTVFSTRTNARDTTYSLITQSLDQSDRGGALTRLLSQVPAPGKRPGGEAGADVGSQYLQAPGDRRIQAIVDSIERGKTTPYEKSLALYRYFRGPDSQFSYSLSTKAGSSGSDLLDFLTNKQGYCEQYASAMAIMARYAGLPARVAIGFTKGVRKNGYWSVSTHDAHAWVEIYFAGIGWVPWDPTPLATGGRAAPLAYATDTDQAGPAGNGTSVGGGGNSGSAGSGRGGLSSKLNTLQDRDNRAIGDPGARLPDLTPPPAPAKPDRTGWWLAGGVVLLMLMLGVPLGRVVQRRRRFRRVGGADPRRAAYAAWDEVLATAQDVGMALNDAESPRATATRLARWSSLEGEGAGGLTTVTRAVERAAYARSVDQQQGLAPAVRAVRSGMLGDSDTLVRVRARVAPSSTLAAAVSGIGRAVAVGFDTLDAAPRLVARLLSRRLSRGTS